MNRIAALGLLTEARTGKADIVVVSATASDTRRTAAAVAAAARAARLEGHTAHLGNGRERIELAQGGSIRFITASRSGVIRPLRGLRPHLLYLDTSPGELPHTAYWDVRELRALGTEVVHR